MVLVERAHDEPLAEPSSVDLCGIHDLVCGRIMGGNLDSVDSDGCFKKRQLHMNRARQRRVED